MIEHSYEPVSQGIANEPLLNKSGQCFLDGTRSQFANVGLAKALDNLFDVVSGNGNTAIEVAVADISMHFLMGLQRDHRASRRLRGTLEAFDTIW